MSINGLINFVLYELSMFQIQPEQVVMSHSPLKMFKQFQDKHVLVCGQGPTVDIAKHLGFTKITSIEALRQHFPTLDMVDHKRRKSAVSSDVILKMSLCPKHLLKE